MMNNDIISAFWFGVIIGVVFLFFILAFGPTTCKKGHDALRECEVNLPRSEYCVIVAVPEQEIKE